MNEYQKNVESFNRLFDKLNAKYFGGTLVKPTITIQVDYNNYGRFTTKKVWIDSKQVESHEINIAPNFKRSGVDITGTLLHEMVHLYASQNGIKDTSRQGRYHNKDFRHLAEEHGLIVEYGGSTVGWGFTRPTEKVAEFYLETRIKVCDLVRSTPERKEREYKARPKKYKYKCPCCEVEIETIKPDLRLKCLTCQVELIRP